MYRSKGLTLIELLVVMCIMGILAAIAYPGYQNHLFKVRRSEAQQQLLLFASIIEEHYLVNRFYSKILPAEIKSDYYYFSILNLSDKTYTLTATPKTHHAQAEDPCGVLSITHQQILGPRASCWE